MWEGGGIVARWDYWGGYGLGVGAGAALARNGVVGDLCVSYLLPPTTWHFWLCGPRSLCLGALVWVVIASRVRSGFCGASLMRCGVLGLQTRVERVRASACRGPRAWSEREDTFPKRDE